MNIGICIHQSCILHTHAFRSRLTSGRGGVFNRRPTTCAMAGVCCDRTRYLTSWTNRICLLNEAMRVCRYQNINFLMNWVLEGSPRAIEASDAADWVVLVSAHAQMNVLGQIEMIHTRKQALKYFLSHAWIQISHENDRTLQRRAQVTDRAASRWSLSTANQKNSFQSFRVRLTGPNSNGYRQIWMCGFEIFGRMVVE